LARFEVGVYFLAWENLFRRGILKGFNPFKNHSPSPLKEKGKGGKVDKH